MHKTHFLGCAAMLVAALAVLAFGDGSGGLGLLVAALLCPLAMILAMRILMPAHHHVGDDAGRAATREGAP